MNSNRNIAIHVGALFIIANIGLFAGNAFYKPILYATNYLENVCPNKLKIIFGVLIDSYLNIKAESAAYLHNIGDAIQSQTQSQSHWINSVGLIYISVFVIGGFIFYSMLYKSKLVPRWISVWGLIADVVLLVASIMGTFYSFSTVTILLFALPIVTQEIVMLIWLIVKGFNESTIAPRSAKVNH